MTKMNNPTLRKPHIVFYFSDTGGGHRSAAEAIIEAIDLEYRDQVTTEMVDFFKDYAPIPFNKAPEMYPYMVKAPRLWSASFHATDGSARARMITTTMWPIARRAARAMIRMHPADLIVTVHPFANTFALKALGKNRPPFINVVTDMVTTHALWFDNKADLILVPTETARLRAIRYHISAEKVCVVGLPVADRYCHPMNEKNALRKKLGWPTERPVVLLVGGGEGMGPLAETAQAIDACGLDVTQVIVCGRNKRLKANLEAHTWENPDSDLRLYPGNARIYERLQFHRDQSGAWDDCRSPQRPAANHPVFKAARPGGWQCHLCPGGGRGRMGADAAGSGAYPYPLDLPPGGVQKGHRELPPCREAGSGAYYCEDHSE